MPYTSDAELPHITNDTMQQGLASTRPVSVLVLEPGPNFTAADARGILFEHGRRNFALRAAGLLSIVCPIADGSGVCGIGVFNAEPDAVQTIYSQDPAVKAGVLTFHVHPS